MGEGGLYLQLSTFLLGVGISTCSCHFSYRGGGGSSAAAATPNSCKLGPYKEGGGVVYCFSHHLFGKKMGPYNNKGGVTYRGSYSSNREGGTLRYLLYVT